MDKCDNRFQLQLKITSTLENEHISKLVMIAIERTLLFPDVA
jgi:hypothetical protein